MSTFTAPLHGTYAADPIHSSFEFAVRYTTTPRAVHALRGAVSHADALIIATPEYNGSVPGALDNALDWASRPWPENSLRGKPVCVIGASTGLFGAVWAQAELRRILATIGAAVLDDELAIGRAGAAFDAQHRLADPALRGRLTEVVTALVHRTTSPRATPGRPRCAEAASRSMRHQRALTDSGRPRSRPAVPPRAPALAGSLSARSSCATMPASMSDDHGRSLLSDHEQAIARQLIDEVDRFNLETTGISEVQEFVVSEGDAGDLVAGVYGWCWGGTCWIEALWVREGFRHGGVGSRLLRAAEAIARQRGCTQMALDTHTFQAPDFYTRHGFEVAGTLPDHPVGHAQLLMYKRLGGPGAGRSDPRPCGSGA
jgi:NAD(P)H-dependent FMN reductase/GNAT superfamily N-acetyltransferase